MREKWSIVGIGQVLFGCFRGGWFGWSGFCVRPPEIRVALVTRDELRHSLGDFLRGVWMKLKFHRSAALGAWGGDGHTINPRQVMSAFRRSRNFLNSTRSSSLHVVQSEYWFRM